MALQKKIFENGHIEWQKNDNERYSKSRQAAILNRSDLFWTTFIGHTLDNIYAKFQSHMTCGFRGDVENVKSRY